MTDAPHYLCVFRADPAVTDDVVDFGLDPDFSAPAPTWGICRPNTRAAVRQGSQVVFVGYLPDTGTYLLKGRLSVGEVIGYADALDRFPDRPNVIVRPSPPASPLASNGWARTALGARIAARHGPAPAFLTTTKTTRGTLVQNPDDVHELDNWKCQRMFRCPEAQLERCNDSGDCLREAAFLDLVGYVVGLADQSLDLGPRRIPWESVAPGRLQGVSLRTPRGQHNHRRLTAAEVDEISAKALSV